MKLTNTLKATAAAAVLALSSAPAFAADIAVIAGSIEDGFFNLIKKGVDDATLVVQANGGSVNYLRTQNYDNFGPDLVALINQAVAQGVDGIAIPVWVPEAQVPALQAAADKGITIMMYNSGQNVKEDVHGVNYFGSDEFVAGQAGGAYMAKNGAKKILCHIQIPGAINLETRCEGVKDGAEANGAEVTILRVPANLDGDITGTAEAIKSELVGDQSIDAVITLAAWASDAATNAVAQINAVDRVKVGTFDMNPAVLDRIKAGTQTMAIDQQPYLQGFLATSMLAAHLDFGTELATDPVLTGPAIVDASNVDTAIEGVKLGAR
ncbi:substrate-binding domain-containing protein [Donghicola mangrovi]|uniref:Substrate-binding domain-containing protein n=1 Tax=Donghicola mangrovi TaxID=2729614 RepID=A0A850Q603_9RHOB|nr:substrate-binding domain-containing protein [Donghicola mangrovi]NVO24383.1 substrate-binding domain-containing protein [Donghicola mangrovi]